MTRYRIQITRLDENEGYAVAWKKWHESNRMYGQREIEPQRFREAEALTFIAEEPVYFAIRKAALESMP